MDAKIFFFFFKKKEDWPSQISPIGMQVHGHAFLTEAPSTWEHSVPSVRTQTNRRVMAGRVVFHINANNLSQSTVSVCFFCVDPASSAGVYDAGDIHFMETLLKSSNLGFLE